MASCTSPSTPAKAISRTGSGILVFWFHRSIPSTPSLLSTKERARPAAMLKIISSILRAIASMSFSTCGRLKEHGLERLFAGVNLRRRRTAARCFFHNHWMGGFMLSALRSWKSWLFILASAGLLWGEAAWSVEKIRLGLSTRNVVLMPFYYARDKKLFDKYGLDVEIIQIRSNLQLAGLVACELDFITGIGTAIEGIGKGMPVKAVAVLYRAPLLSLLSQLPNAKSLEGKKISVSRIGSESHFNGVVMLEKSGVDLKTVTWIQTGNTALNMLALERGLVEGAVLSPPFTGIMARKGFKVLRRSGDVIDASPFNGLVTTREKIQ